MLLEAILVLDMDILLEWTAVGASETQSNAEVFRPAVIGIPASLNSFPASQPPPTFLCPKNL